MSNHSGSYMLNEVLTLLDEEGVFTAVGKEKAQHLVLEVLAISNDYDCNSGEILENIGQKLGICSYCHEAKDDIKKGLCAACRKELDERRK